MPQSASASQVRTGRVVRGGESEQQRLLHTKLIQGERAKGTERAGARAQLTVNRARARACAHH